MQRKDRECHILYNGAHEGTICLFYANNPEVYIFSHLIYIYPFLVIQPLEMIRLIN